MGGVTIRRGGYHPPDFVWAVVNNNGRGDPSRTSVWGSGLFSMIPDFVKAVAYRSKMSEMKTTAMIHTNAIPFRLLAELRFASS